MDVFGKAFKDYMDGITDQTIRVHTDVTEPEELPVSYFFRSWPEMPEWEKLVLERSAGRVLDAGAGAGSHALELQRRGLHVVAVDVSPGAVETMRRRGVKDPRCQSFFDIREETFDTILFLMNGAGIAGTLPGLSRLLKHAASLLAPEGQIFIESTDLMYIYEVEDGSILIPVGDRYYGQLQYRLEYKGLKTKPFSWLYADPDTLQHTARECGLNTDIIHTSEAYNYVAELTHA